MSAPVTQTVVDEQPNVPTATPVASDSNTKEQQPSSLPLTSEERLQDNHKDEPEAHAQNSNADVKNEIPGDSKSEDNFKQNNIVPHNTPVAADSGQVSPTMKSSTESLSDEAAIKVEADTSSPDASHPNQNSNSSNKPESDFKQIVPAAAKPLKELKKEEKKEEKKKSKKKEDKSIDYILRALNSLQSPEEKLAALCKKYADLHEEHRVLQTSFKTQQRTMAMIMREKDQIQSEHTKAIMAKSKLESLCRELQKHNKIIKDESIKRAKEDDEKRKEISAQFNHTIGEIQSQMTDNSERNSKLRQENENLAAQLRTFIKQCEVRDLQVEKLHEQHELEKKLAEVKMNQAQAIIKEQEEKANKERELMLLKLAESGRKSQILEAQVNMFKERYDEFEQLHTRSNDTFQKYKTEMDKMTKRIKKLEKDGLQWKNKWEGTNKALIEQIEARGKAEKETLTYVQKSNKLESLCRALQAELRGSGNKVAVTNTNKAENPAASPPPSGAVVASTEGSKSEASSSPAISPSPSPKTAEPVAPATALANEEPSSLSPSPSPQVLPSSSLPESIQPISPGQETAAAASEVLPVVPAAISEVPSVVPATVPEVPSVVPANVPDLPSVAAVSEVPSVVSGDTQSADSPAVSQSASDLTSNQAEACREAAAQETIAAV